MTTGTSSPSNPRPEPEPHPHWGHGRKGTWWDYFRSRFIAGLVTIIPALVTIWAVMFLVRLLDRNLGGNIKPIVLAYLDLLGWPERLAGPLTISISMIVAIFFIFSLGVLLRFLLVRKVISIGEKIVERIPLVRFFYITPREVIRTITTSRNSVKRVVMIQYPRKGIWALAYATGEFTLQPEGRKMVNVFAPTTPNPTSGFLLMLPAEDVYDLNLTTEDAVRFIISGGILSPSELHITTFAGLTGQPDDLPPPAELETAPPPVEGVTMMPDNVPPRD